MKNLLKDRKFHLPVLIGLALVLFLAGIGFIPLTDGDSAFYAKIAKNIVETGDWLTMHYGDAQTIVDKPPLFMWLTAASFKVFGVNDFAVSFWHGIFAVLIVLFTYKLAELIFDARTAFISGVILITSSGFFYLARSPLLDIPLTLFVLLAVYCYLLYEKSKDIRMLYLSPVFMSLAVLAKGPVGLALPLIVIAAYLLINKKKFPPLLHIIGCAAVFLAVTLPWYIAEYRILGRQFIDVMVSKNFGRYFMPVDTVGSEAVKYRAIEPQYDLYSFFLQIFALFVPWSGFLYPAFYRSFRKKLNNLPAIFSLAVMLFFSLSLNYKISRYILPAFPALAIVTGAFIAGILAKKDKLTQDCARISYWISIILALPLLLTGLYMIFRRFPEVKGPVLPVFLPFITLLIAALITGSVLGLMKKHEKALTATASIISISYLALIAGLILNYGSINPVSRFCRYIDMNAKPGDIVCQYRGTDAHFMIYYSRNEVQFIRDEDEILNLLLGREKVFCVSEDRNAYDELKRSLANRITKIDESANFTLFTN